MAMAKVGVAGVKEVAAMDPATIDLIDVRTPGEFAAVHAVGARLAPLGNLDAAQVASARQGAPGTPIYVICKTGPRARTAAQKFAALGIDVVVVEGGTDAWVAAGLPVERGQGGLTASRQVGIVAGLLMVTGVILAWKVSVWYVGLSVLAVALMVMGRVGE
jgi:rhodanese-related sulfurtransferase